METQEVKELKEVLNNVAGNKNTDFSNIEKQADLIFKANIGGYVHSKKYDGIKECLDVILKSERLHSLMVLGKEGLGKSYIIKSILKQKKKDFLYVNNYSTSLALYITIFENRDKIIILDDVDELLRDNKGISLLKAVLNTEKERIVCYNSTSEKLRCPSQFIFKGKIIILCNSIPTMVDRATISRLVKREIYFNLKDKIEMSEKILKEHYPDLKNPEKIIDFIKNNVDESVINFSFRTILKIAEFYINSQNWEKYAVQELEIDEEIVLIKKIIDYEINERNKVWYETTGKSERTLQRKIKEIKKIRGETTNDKNC